MGAPGAREQARMIAPSPTPSPDVRAAEIFARTRAAFAARQYPPRIHYSVRVSGFKDGAWTGRSYEATERWPSGEVHAQSISEEERANPVKPHGINIGVGGFTPVSQENHDILGIPKLAPTYAFGLAAPVPRRQAEATPEPGAPRTIASVEATARTYDIRLFREESVEGDVCWHLLLRPLADPGKYRLRDLWVDEKTYQTIRLRTDGNFTAKETGSGLWTVAYTWLDGFWYLSSEVSNGPVETDDGTYEHIAVQFLNIAPAERQSFDFGFAGESDEPDLVEP